MSPGVWVKHCPAAEPGSGYVHISNADLDRLMAREDVAEARGRKQIIDALRDRKAATVVGRLFARTDGDANGIQVVAELANYLESINAPTTTAD